MIVFTLLKIILCLWILLLIVQSISNNILSLALISGTIITTMPFVLWLAWIAGSEAFRAVFLFSLFVIVVITLQVLQLGLG